MANSQGSKPNLDRYVVIHVATTCDEHGVFVTKDSAELIELGWILLDAKSAEEVRVAGSVACDRPTHLDCSSIGKAFLSNLRTHPSLHCAVRWLWALSPEVRPPS